MNHRPQCLAFVALVALSSCGHDKDPNRLPNAPKMPPPPPKVVATPIDPQLNEAARKILADAFAGRLKSGRSEDPAYLRANAVEATQRALGAAGAERILQALDDKEGVVRFAGTMAAGQIPLPAAYERLRTLANDPNIRVQIGARFALHKLGDQRLTHDFERYIINPRPYVRADAVLALGLLGEPSGMKLLDAVRDDPDPGVRLQVVEAKYRLGDEKARDELIVGTVSAYPDDQIISLLALASTHDDRLLKTFLGQLTSDYPEVALAAARGLGQLGSDEGMGVALRGVKAGDARQRTLAALALGDIRRSDAQSALRPLLDDSDSSVRIAAAEAILQLKQ